MLQAKGGGAEEHLPFGHGQNTARGQENVREEIHRDVETSGQADGGGGRHATGVVQQPVPHPVRVGGPVQRGPTEVHRHFEMYYEI